MGTVFWITGFSGAGKTTIGALLCQRIKKIYPNTVFLDGDALREMLGGDLGYTREERRRCAMRYARLCAILQEQGMHVVCCTVSMFDSVREWNRKNIRNYREIYVKASKDTLRARNQKGLYSGAVSDNGREAAGTGMEPEEPDHPDLTLVNDGERTPQEQAEEIVRWLGAEFFCGEGESEQFAGG